MFEHVVELQDRVVAITDRSEAILNDPSAREITILRKSRWEVTRALREYQLYKHNIIFDPVIRRGDNPAEQARLMKAECIRFGDDFTAHVLKWSSVSIADCWDDYRPAAMQSIFDIRAQLAKERHGIAELLGLVSGESA